MLHLTDQDKWNTKQKTIEDFIDQANDRQGPNSALMKSSNVSEDKDGR
jgi:hypothetical protein